MTETSSRRRPAAIVGILLVLAAALAAGANAGEAAAEAFERLKALEGEWLAAADGPMAKQGDLVSRFEVTASGTAVVETHFPGGSYEMVTVYYREGEGLALSHYCIGGNQPRMRATELAGSRIQFAFDAGGNIPDPKSDRHMNSVWIEFVGQDEIRTEWTEIADGEPILVVPMHLVRKGT